jgi:Fe2+ or Zn2+ uptake regulation protein
MTALIAGMKRSKLRVTEPRRAILELLMVEHGPFTAEEIHKRLGRKGCDQVTVYRCVTSLEKAGLIARCEFGDGAARYELVEKGNFHHHHVVCRRCKKVETLDDCDLQDINRFARGLGFSDVTHSLEFFGTCPTCKRGR